MSATEAIQPDSWPQALLHLLERQQAMMNELVALAQSQAALIAEGHPDRLLNVLARRQSVINEFTASQSQLTHYTQGLDQRMETLACAERERIKSLISEIGDRLADVMRRDEQDQATLRGHRDQVKHELHSLGSARKARVAYHPAPGQKDRFADRHA